LKAILLLAQAPVHESVKQRMVEADERSTVLMFRTMHNTARVFKNKVWGCFLV